MDFVIPDSQSDGSGEALDVLQVPASPPYALLSNDAVPSPVEQDAWQKATADLCRDPLPPSSGHQPLVGAESRDEFSVSPVFSPRCGSGNGCPMNAVSDLLHSLSRSLSNIKDEVIRLEVAFDALLVNVETHPSCG